MLGIRLRDVFTPGSRYTPSEIIEYLHELPDSSAFVASVRASAPPEAAESAVVTALRKRRAFRGWTTDRELTARIGDALTGKAYPRPYGDGAGGGRRVLELDQMP